MAQKPEKPSKPCGQSNSLDMGTGIAIGVALGISLGVALDNIALGISIGMGVGVALGAGGESQKRKNCLSDESEGE